MRSGVEPMLSLMLCCVCYTVVAGCVAAPPRPVVCAGTQRAPNPAEDVLMTIAFGGFQEGRQRYGGRAYLNFESLIAFGFDTVDLAELLYVVRSLESVVDASNVTVQDVLARSEAAFAAIAGQHAQHLSTGTAWPSAVVLGREQLATATWYALSVRFALNHSAPATRNAFDASYKLFSSAVELLYGCQRVRVPHGGVSLYGVFCRGAIEPHVCVVGMTGFDGTLLSMFNEIGPAVLDAGYSLLVLMGPGQGESAAYSGTTFTRDWGSVVEAAFTVVAQQGAGVNQTVLWCRSFGGFLCAQAASNSAVAQTLTALVLDGGVKDMYQNVLCSLPDALQSLYMNNRTAFDGIMASAQTQALSLASMMGWAQVGFRVSSFGALLDAFATYALQSSDLAALAAVPLFVNNPPLDTATGHQSSLLWNALPTHRAGSVLFEPPVESGVALHCGVGSTRNNNLNILQWIHGVLKQQQ